MDKYIQWHLPISSGKGWQARYFVPEHSVLSYYARKEAKEVAGVIGMKTCTGMTASYAESGKLELLLATTMKGAKKYRLRSISADVERWHTELKRAMLDLFQRGLRNF